MKIEVKDKYTGKNIKEPNSEIPDPPKPEEKPEEKSEAKEIPEQKTTTRRRRRKTPIGFILTVAAIVGIIGGLIFAIIVFTKKSDLIGTWVRENDVWTYEFKEDGSGSYGLGFGTPMAFHYKDKGDHIEVTYDKKGNQVNFEYHFEEDKLIIKDQLGNNQTYKRKGAEDNPINTLYNKTESTPSDNQNDTPAEDQGDSSDDTDSPSFIEDFKNSFPGLRK